jgi:PAS domain S-box-containing protein
MTSLDTQEARCLVDYRATAIHVLHVDDDMSLLEVSKQILCMESNFEIDHACCAAEALTKLASCNYDIIVSDYEMPQKDGLQFLKELRQSKKQIPFILFTGKGREEVAIKALNLGADGYYNKQGPPETVYGELAHGIRSAFAHKEAQDKIKKEENLRAILLDNLPCTALILEKGTRTIVASNKIAQDLGAIPGRTCFGTCANRSVPCQFCLAPKLWETNQAQSLEVEYEGKYYKGIWVPYSKDLYIHYILDITEQKKAELTIQESDSRLRLHLESSPLAIFIANRAAKYEYVNDAACKLLGYSKEELLNMNIPEIVFENDLKQGIVKFNEAIKAGNSWREIDLKRKDGSPVPVILNITKLPDGNLAGYCQNITELRKAEKNHREAEKKLRTIIDSSPDGITLTDMSGKVIDCNQAALDLFGCDCKEDVIGTTGFGVHTINEKERDKVFRDFENLLKNGSISGVQWRLQDKSGAPFVGEVYGKIVKDEKGKPQFSVTITRNITIHKKIEKLLEEHEEKYHALFSSMSEGVCIHELIYDKSGKAVDYKILDVNPSIRSITRHKTKRCHREVRIKTL